ncbi:hypothetical protein llap_8228 [Limosa lapponica baueri]|uniref:Uncharacterized protein n=1 Tax=Limosa lapponica baueri TaxID=1758121 RepID=A0A2I0U5X6_LIMLA|nr:hypothetical protein llap_8228 [Limosa lapponica baueri]
MASRGRLAHTAELSSSGAAIYCPNSDTYGENIGHTQVPGNKRGAFRVAEGVGQCPCKSACLGKVVVIGTLLEESKPVVRKGKKKEDLGTYKLVTLSSGTGKIMEQILEAISRHMKNEKVNRNSQCRFT